jgi:hypothetical protein
MKKEIEAVRAAQQQAGMAKDAQQRLAGDPFSNLCSGSAAALHARMDQLVPIWVEYVTLTAVTG